MILFNLFLNLYQVISNIFKVFATELPLVAALDCSKLFRVLISWEVKKVAAAKIKTTRTLEATLNCFLFLASESKRRLFMLLLEDRDDAFEE